MKIPIPRVKLLSVLKVKLESATAELAKKNDPVLLAQTYKDKLSVYIKLQESIADKLVDAAKLGIESYNSVVRKSIGTYGNQFATDCPLAIVPGSYNGYNSDTARLEKLTIIIKKLELSESELVELEDESDLNEYL